MSNINQKLNSLEKAIISTLAYFKVHKYPLTLLEICKWLYRSQNSKLKTPCLIGSKPSRRQNYNSKLETEEFENIKVSDIQRALDESKNLKKIINCKNGFYYLKVYDLVKGDEDLVELRKKRHNLARSRWKKLRRIATLLQIVPNLKMLAACNTLVLNDIKEDSDIDAFVIIKDQRMWQTRFFITALVALLGQWRHKDNIANKICLSFYMTDKNLNLKWLSKKPYDPMLTYWVTFVYPLLDREMEISGKCLSVISNEVERNEKSLEHNQKDLLREYSGQASTSLRSARDDKIKSVSVYDKFIEENEWIREYVPNFIKYNPNLLERKVAKIFIFDILRRSFEVILNTRIGDFTEKIFKKIQEGKMKKNTDSWRRDDTDVIISDQMLKFHEKDRRDLFREMYEENLRQFIENK